MVKTNKGITLIALVITIIILLILAGVTISTLTESGLFDRAKEAKQESENAKEKENAILKDYESTLNEYLSGAGGSSSGGSEDEETLTLQDTEDTKPEQARPVNSTIIEADATKGIVIADEQGNEWVWVEVPKTTVFKTAKSETKYANIKADLVEYAKDYRNGAATQTLEWDDEYYEGCGVVATETKTAEEVYTEMYNKMLSSVYTNGGFWISRYEIGDATATANNTARTADSGTTGTAVSKADQIPYNLVTCSQAQTVASTMSTDTNQTSSLLFGIQWDLTCKFIEENTDLVLADINSDSTEWGNYKNNSLILNRGKYNINPGATTSVWTEYTIDTENYVTNRQTSISTSYSQLLTTGASEEANKMNIYDLAGNEWEWTLEYASIGAERGPCSVRGGNYVDFDGIIAPVCYRSNNKITEKYHSISFRSTLY